MLESRHFLVASWCLALLLAFAPTVEARQGIDLIASATDDTLLGKVVESDGVPLPGVTITVRAQDGRTFTLVTDAEGKFRLPNLSYGVYEVRAELAGFATVSREVLVEPVYTSPPPEEDPPFTIVRVYYGTNRHQVGDALLGADYTGDRAPLAFGSCTVSIPRDHRLGHWERPTILTLNVPDQTKHVMLLNVTPLANDAFMTALRGQVERSAGKEAFVFVHGYNVSFRDAVQRTALLAYDLKFDGAPITFSWPSRGDAKKYFADEATVEYSIPDLETFLRTVSASGATKIHLIAHSMGNRALLRALANLHARGEAPANLGQTVFTAPDVDRDVFTQLVSVLRDLAPRLTLYASSKDKAIRASRKVHDAPRAGEGGRRILIVNGVDSIDASALDTSFLNHSYYAENKSVISDLFELIHSGREPAARICLAKRQRRGGGDYYVFDRCR
jgi:esterase/lipase superfamily enzyme